MAFFDADAPASLARIDGLMPGDFAVVARQLSFATSRPQPDEIVALLAAEARSRRQASRRVGFETARVPQADMRVDSGRPCRKLARPQKG